MWICTALGKGLVVWGDTETFKDMKSIASSDVYDKPIWTALNNKDNKNCDGASACDGKLVISNVSKIVRVLEYHALSSVMATDNRWANRVILAQF